MADEGFELGVEVVDLVVEVLVACGARILDRCWSGGISVFVYESVVSAGS